LPSQLDGVRLAWAQRPPRRCRAKAAASTGAALAMAVSGGRATNTGITQAAPFSQRMLGGGQRPERRRIRVRGGRVRRLAARSAPRLMVLHEMCSAPVKARPSSPFAPTAPLHWRIVEEHGDDGVGAQFRFRWSTRSNRAFAQPGFCFSLAPVPYAQFMPAAIKRRPSPSPRVSCLAES